MKNYNLKAMKNQAGMTLIELTVVLLVLIGLAGLTLPYVSGFIGKTHNSTSADSGSALYSALTLYQTQNLSYPQNLNLLSNTTGTTAAPLSYLDNGFTANTTNFSAISDVANATDGSGNIASSLSNAGITKVALLPTGGVTVNADGTYTATGNIAAAGATFTPEIVGATINSAVSNNKFITDSVGGYIYTNAGYGGVAKKGISGALGYNVPNGHRMIVLGVGAANSAVGKSLASVPVHFGDKGSLQPTYTYSRFLAAVDVDATDAQQAAKIVGIVHAPDTGDQWESLYSSIAGYYGG